MDVRPHSRWIRLCLYITFPRDNRAEVDLFNGNPSITTSQPVVHSITLLPAWLPVIIYWSGRRSFQVQVGVVWGGRRRREGVSVTGCECSGGAYYEGEDGHVSLDLAARRCQRPRWLLMTRGTAVLRQDDALANWFLQRKEKRSHRLCGGWRGTPAVWFPLCWFGESLL